MGGGVPRILVLAAAILLAAVAARALARRRWASLLLHAGFALVLFGWLQGQSAPGVKSGAMALVDGEESGQLCGGEKLDIPLVRLPFRIRLERFLIDYYESGMPREYRSRVTVLEPGREPYVQNITVNHPLRIGCWDIYQMSYGKTFAQNGAPALYTVLEFIRRDGLRTVYCGFAALVLGTVFLAAASRRKGAAR